MKQQQVQPGGEQQVEGFRHELFEAYNGEGEPSEEQLQELLANAPPEVQARAKEWAEQRSKLEAGGTEGAEAEREEQDAKVE